MKPIVKEAQDDLFNRKVIEQGACNILNSPEATHRKDTLKQVDSGLNHIVARIARTKNIAIGINIEGLALLPLYEKARRLARIRQNLALCRKAHTRLAIHGTRAEARAILLSLGASTNQVKEALSQSF